METSNSMLLTLCMLMVNVYTALSVCTESKTQIINDNHPNKTSNWEEHEGFNSTYVNIVCPLAIYVVQELECIDEKNESLSMSSQWVNTTVYTALCNLKAGLVCRPKNNSHCPDFRIKYTCKCRNISTTSLHPSTRRTATVPLSTKTSGTDTSPMASPTSRQSGQTNENHTGNDGLPLAGIIGIAVGGLLLLVVSCLLLIYCIKQKQKEKVHIVKELQI